MFVLCSKNERNENATAIFVLGVAGMARERAILLKHIGDPHNEDKGEQEERGVGRAGQQSKRQVDEQLAKVVGVAAARPQARGKQFTGFELRGVGK